MTTQGDQVCEVVLTYIPQFDFLRWELHCYHRTNTTDHPRDSLHTPYLTTYNISETKTTTHSNIYVAWHCFRTTF